MALFKDVFQGGPYCEVFSAQIKDGVSSIKFWNQHDESNIERKWDQCVKSFAYFLEGNHATCNVSTPPTTRQTLGLTQPYIIVQLYIPKEKHFSIEIGVMTTHGSRLRLLCSTSTRESHLNALHYRLPLGFVTRDQWFNACFDLVSLLASCGQSYQTIDSLSISANCRLRRIYTMKSQPKDLGGGNAEVPKMFQFNTGDLQSTQIIDIGAIHQYEGKAVEDVNPTNGQDEDLNSSGNRKGDYHIAFGSKIAKPAVQHTQKKPTAKESHRGVKSAPARSRTDPHKDGNRVSSGGKERSEKAIISSMRERKNSDPGTPRTAGDDDITVDKESLRNSKTWTDGTEHKEDIPFVRPHPPSKPSASGERRRKPRVKSAGKERSRNTSFESSGISSKESSLSSLSHLSSQENIPLTPSSSQSSCHSNTSHRITSATDIMLCDRNSTLKKSRSDSDIGTPDSMEEIISTLKASDYKHKEYEDSDNSDTGQKKLYTFASKPKKAPHQSAPQEVDKYMSKQHRTHGRRRSHHNNRESIQDNNHHRRHSSNKIVLSSDDENENVEVKKHTRKNSKHNKPNHHNGDYPPLHVDTTHQQPTGARPKDNHLAPVKDYRGLSPGQQDYNRLSPGIRDYRGLSPGPITPSGSQSRRCVSRKDLREISPDKLNQTQQKQYNSKKYQMIELTDSCEVAMLQQLKRETEEDQTLSDKDDSNKPNSTKQYHSFNYEDHSAGSSDETQIDTLKARDKLKNNHHNYLEEMNMSSLKMTPGSLDQSNPRDWSSLYSPPINSVTDITSSTNTDLTSAHDHPIGLVAQISCDSQGQDTDGEKELDLLYDPVLNYYYDPSTCKYYELNYT